MAAGHDSMNGGGTGGLSYGGSSTSYDSSNSLGNNSYGTGDYSLGTSYDHNDSLGNGYGSDNGSNNGYSNPGSYQTTPTSTSVSYGGGSSDGGYSSQGNSFGSAGVTDNGNGSSNYNQYSTNYTVVDYDSTPAQSTKVDKVTYSGPTLSASDFKLSALDGVSAFTASKHTVDKTPGVFDLEALVSGPPPKAATAAEAADLLGYNHAEGELANNMRMAVGDVDRAATNYQELTAPLSYGDAYGVASLQKGYGERLVSDAQNKLLGVQVVGAAIDAVVEHPKLAEELRMNHDAEIAGTKRLVSDAISTAERFAEVSQGQPALDHDVVLAARDADFAKTALEARVAPPEAPEVANVFHRALFGGGIPHDPRLDAMTDLELANKQAGQQMLPGAASTLTAYKASPAIAAALGELVPAIGQSTLLGLGARLLIGTEMSRILTPPYQAVSDEALLALDEPIVNPSRGILNKDNLLGDQVSGAVSTGVAMAVGDGIKYAVPALATLAGVTVPPVVVTGLALTGAAVASSHAFALTDMAQGKLRDGIIDHNDPADVAKMYEGMTPSQVQDYDDYWGMVKQQQEYTDKQAADRDTPGTMGGLPGPGHTPALGPFTTEDPKVLEDQIKDYLDGIDKPVDEPGLVAGRPEPRPTPTEPGTVVAELPDDLFGPPEPRPSTEPKPTVVATLDEDSFDFTPSNLGGGDNDIIALPHVDDKPGSIGSGWGQEPLQSLPNNTEDGPIIIPWWLRQKQADSIQLADTGANEGLNDLDFDIPMTGGPMAPWHGDALA